MSIQYKPSSCRFISLYLSGKRTYMFDKRCAPRGDRWVTLNEQGELIERGDALSFTYLTFDEVMFDLERNFSFS